MAYIGTSPSNGVRRVHTYTATANQTTFTGSSTEGVTLTYADTNYIDVFQNGVLLGSADYTSTSGTSVVLAQGASVSDLVVIVVYDVFSVADTVSKTAGGSFDSAVTMSGGLVIADGGNIGSASDTDAIAISSGGVVTFSQTTVGAGGMDLLYTLTSSSSVSAHDISSTYINSTYDNYSLVGYFEGDADTRYLQMQVFVGGTIQTGNIHAFSNMHIDSADDHSNAQGEPNLVTTSVYGMGGEDGEGVSVNAVFQNANSTQAPFCVSGFATLSHTSANHAGYIFSGSLIPANRANVVNGLRLKMHSGNINYAKFKLYGLKD